MQLVASSNLTLLPVEFAQLLHCGVQGMARNAVSEQKWFIKLQYYMNTIVFYSFYEKGPYNQSWHQTEKI